MSCIRKRRIGALSPEEAAKTLAHRFGPRVDRLRQLSTRFGLRPYRCFLVWTRWSGDERGEGGEVEVARIELLPTPLVDSLDQLALKAHSAGLLPEGSIRLREVSVNYSEDQLRGKLMPQGVLTPDPPGTAEEFDVRHRLLAPATKAKLDFFYEVIEDGRSGDLPTRAKYRVSGVPFRDAGKLQWTVVLTRASEDNDRFGKSQVGTDRADF